MVRFPFIPLVEYLISIFIFFLNHRTEETLINTIDCMILMLQRGIINSLDDLFELYAVLFNIIDVETNTLRG